MRSDVWDEGFEGKYVRGRERDELGSGKPFSLSIGILAAVLGPRNRAGSPSVQVIYGSQGKCLTEQR